MAEQLVWLIEAQQVFETQMYGATQSPVLTQKFPVRPLIQGVLPSLLSIKYRPMVRASKWRCHIFTGPGQFQLMFGHTQNVLLAHRGSLYRYRHVAFIEDRLHFLEKYYLNSSHCVSSTTAYVCNSSGLKTLRILNFICFKRFVSDLFEVCLS
jgi:hypothetical protein